MSHPIGVRRVQRATSGRWVAGVCGGIADHLGVAVGAVRLAFVVAALAGGVGLVAYALMWAFLPLGPDPGPRAPRPDTKPPAGWDVSGLLAILALSLGVLLALGALGAPVRVSVWAPVLLFGAGVAVLWQQSDDAQRDYLRQRAQAGVQATAGAEPASWLRTILGLGLVLAGVVAAIGPRVDLWTGLRALAAAGAVGAGLFLIALPWLAAMVRRAQVRRYEEVRREERAAMAARVHDSVLQTLTLIQRRADDPREVMRLARAEERALRSWLYAPGNPSGTLAAELAHIVAACEADYDTRIELVTVGDTAVDHGIAELLAATRESVVNAAKHAGAPVAVYAEVAEGQVEVNVKDRGCGFDPQAVGTDRHGVRQSIIARTVAAGGTASVRSGVGEGTEVRLKLPLMPGGQHA